MTLRLMDNIQRPCVLLGWRGPLPLNTPTEFNFGKNEAVIVSRSVFRDERRPVPRLTVFICGRCLALTDGLERCCQFLFAPPPKVFPPP